MKVILLVSGFLPIAVVTVLTFFGTTEAATDAQSDLPDPEMVRKFLDKHAENVETYQADFINPLIDRDLLAPKKVNEESLPADSDLRWMKDVSKAYDDAKESRDVAISFKSIGNVEPNTAGPSSKDDLKIVLKRLDDFLADTPNAGSVRDFVTKRKAGIEAELAAIDMVQQAATNLQAKDFDACLSGLASYNRTSDIPGVKARIAEVDRLLRLAKFRKHWQDRPTVDQAALLNTARTTEEGFTLQEKLQELSDLRQNSPSLDPADTDDQVLLDEVDRELVVLSIKLRVIKDLAVSPVNVDALLDKIGAILEDFRPGKTRPDPFACRETQNAFTEWLTAKGSNRLAKRDAKVSPTLKQAIHKNDGLVIADFGELKATDYYLFLGADGKDKQIYLDELRGGAIGELTNASCTTRFNARLAELLKMPHQLAQWEAFEAACQQLDQELAASERTPRAKYSLTAENVGEDPKLGLTRAMLMFDRDASIARSVIEKFSIVKQMYDDRGNR